MFYLFYGQDRYRTKQKLDELQNFFLSKIGRLGIFLASDENFDLENFEVFLRVKNLFENKSIIFCNDLLKNKLAADFIIQNIDKMADSENIFLFTEEEINDDYLSLFKEKAEKVQKFDLLTGAKLKKWLEEEIKRRKIKISPADKDGILEQCGSDLWCVSSEIEKYSLGGKIQPSKQISDYNPFAICDAVANKDRKKAWILLQQAILNGVAAEEIFWKLWWQAKSLLIVRWLLSQGQTLNLEKESGLKPYPFQKAIFAVKNFSQSELDNFSWNLVDLFHKSKIKQIDMETGLEKLIVNL